MKQCGPSIAPIYMCMYDMSIYICIAAFPAMNPTSRMQLFLFTYAYVYVRVYIYIYMYAHPPSNYVHTHIDICIHMYAQTYVNIIVNTTVLYIACIHIHIHISLFCIRIYIYILMHIHIHVHLLMARSLSVSSLSGLLERSSHPHPLLMAYILHDFRRKLYYHTSQGFGIFWHINQHPQLPSKTPQIPSNRDHKALNRGTLGGLGSHAGIL